jgi:SAM-dependent methyltransferase
VLDVGCGAAGHVGRFVADLGARVVGIDLSERSVSLARGLNPTLRFVAADVAALPIAEASVAGIVAFYSLIYGAMDFVVAALAELRRVLRPDGELFIAVHEGSGAQRFTDYKGTPVDVELHYRDPESLTAALTKSGFLVTRIEPRSPYPFEHPTTRLYVTARRR